MTTGLVVVVVSRRPSFVAAAVEGQDAVVHVAPDHVDKVVRHRQVLAPRQRQTKLEQQTNKQTNKQTNR